MGVGAGGVVSDEDELPVSVSFEGNTGPASLPSSSTRYRPRLRGSPRSPLLSRRHTAPSTSLSKSLGHASGIIPDIDAGTDKAITRRLSAGSAGDRGNDSNCDKSESEVKNEQQPSLPPTHTARAESKVTAVVTATTVSAAVAEQAEPRRPAIVTTTTTADGRATTVERSHQGRLAEERGSSSSINHSGNTEVTRVNEQVRFESRAEKAAEKAVEATVEAAVGAMVGKAVGVAIEAEEEATRAAQVHNSTIAAMAASIADLQEQLRRQAAATEAMEERHGTTVDTLRRDETQRQAEAEAVKIRLEEKYSESQDERQGELRHHAETMKGVKARQAEIAKVC